MLAEKAEVAGESYVADWLERLDAERDNFRAALRWALDAGQPVLALQLANTLGRFWVIRAHREGYGWLSEGLEAAREAPADVRARALMWAASTVWFTGDFARATALSEESLGLFRELGDDENVAALLDRLAAGRMVEADLDEARTMAEESLAIFRSLGNQAGAAHPMAKIAHIEVLRGDLDRGVRLLEEALELAREIGDWWLAGHLMIALADVERRRGNTARAAVLCREGIAVARDLQNVPQLINAFAVIAGVEAAAGRSRRAGVLWGAVETIEREGTATLEDDDRAAFETTFLARPDPELQAGRDEGRALSLDEAVAFALAD
jgi:ATP/maltotriose-dependent transcriptional regulator MalT